MRRVLLALAVALAALVLPAASPASAAGRPVAAVQPPLAIPIPGGFAVVAGASVGGPGGPDHDFVGECSVTFVPPLAPTVSTLVACRVNGAAIAASPLTPGGAGAAASTTVPVTLSSSTGFTFCIAPLVVGAAIFVPPVCTAFVDV